MKIVMSVFLLFSTCILMAQTEVNHFFSKSNFSLLSGISSEKFSEAFGVVYFEGATDLTENIFVKLSAGYYKSLSNSSYRVNTNKFVKSDVCERLNTMLLRINGTRLLSSSEAPGISFTSQ